MKDNGADFYDELKNRSQELELEDLVNDGDEIFIDPIEVAKFQKVYNVLPIRPSSINVSDFKTLSLEDMVKDIPPKQEYVFYPCLPTQGIGWIYAATGMGKTLFTLNLAYAIASGGSFLKYTCPLPRKVLYVDGEMPYNQLHARTMMIREREGSMPFSGNLHFLTPDKLLPLIDCFFLDDI